MESNHVATCLVNRICIHYRLPLAEVTAKAHHSFVSVMQNRNPYMWHRKDREIGDQCRRPYASPQKCMQNMCLQHFTVWTSSNQDSSCIYTNSSRVLWSRIGLFLPFVLKKKIKEWDRRVCKRIINIKFLPMYYSFFVLQLISCFTKKI